MSLQSTTTRQCTSRSSDKKTIPQTMFLGASVSNFTCNLGWGQQASSINVNLVNDKSPYCSDTQLSISGAGVGADNHYYDNTGDDLYISYDPNNGRGILPGKMYYQWSGSSNKFVSKYRTTEDPGFFGVNNEWVASNTGYDIIGNPAFFKMMDFEYAGLIKNWEYSDNSGGGTISVTLESPVSLLSNSYLIIGDYTGCVFGKTQAMSLGGPKNWSKSGLTNTGTISQGAIHNLFNVFGYLESFGFGNSDFNEQGIPASFILDGLQSLTSITPRPLATSEIARFSPFARIIGRTAIKLSDSTAAEAGFYSYGLFPPTTAMDGRLRHQYVLDLSEVPRPDSSFRLTGPVISIMDLITQITDATARDFFVELIAYNDSGSILPMIKVRTINRAGQPAPQLVRGIVESISSTYQVSNRTYGQEQGEATNRAMLIGGPQQRLFQAKNYRLAYKQTNYAYNPANNSFINYKEYPNSKWREPSLLSTRMPAVSDLINGSFSWLFGDEPVIKQAVEGVGIATTSTAFQDTTNGPALTNVVVAAPGAGIPDGNYAATGNQAACEVVTPANATTTICQPTDGPALQLYNPPINIPNRFIPLFNDIITPFFGFRFEKGAGNTEGLPEESLKQARPVYLDAMTGQLVVVCDVADLPPLKYGIKSIYSGNRFVVSESEMRAAMAGFDNLLLYYSAKTYKPDLILMLQKTYLDTGNSTIDSDDTPMGLSAWGMIEDQNAAGDDGFSVAPYADQDEDVNVTNILYSRSFTEDLMLLHQFIADIAEKYYGKTYSVRVPNVVAYRDWTSGGNQQVGEDLDGNPVYVWSGAPKVFYNYEVATDGAWEEPGNYIDDNIVIGSQDYYALVDETGKIQPILGYNASDNFDSTAYALCSGGHLQNANYRSYKNSPVFGIDTYSMHVNEFSGGCDHAKFYYPSIDLSPVAEEVLLKNTNLTKTPFNTHDILGRKAYVKAQVRPNFYFTNPSSFAIPRAIIESPGLFLNNSSLEYSQDPNKTVISNVALEDLMIYIMTNTANVIDSNIVAGFASRLSHLYNGLLLRTKHKKQENAQMVDLAPKAAHPFFAAIPLKSNRFVYGPWINYPHQDPGSGLSSGTDTLENAVANIRVESDPDLVPWNYGSVSVLDRAALLKLSEMTTFQNIIETGGFEIPGLPIFGLGSKLYSGTPSGSFIYSNQGFNTSTMNDAAGNSYNILIDTLGSSGIPVITNMQTSVSESKISTSYSLKIYSKPLSRFNKEAADRLKKIASETTKRNQRDAINTRKLIGQQTKIFQDSVSRRQSGFTGYSTKDASKKLLGWSPVGIIIGAGTYYSSPPTKGKSLGVKNANAGQRSRSTGVGETNTNTTSTSVGKFRGSRGDWDISASFDGSLSNVPYDQAQGPINTMYKDLRHSANLFIYQGKESGLASLQNYGDKAIMSLDGILSPVSFYPGRYSSCYSMAKWPRARCPICCGSKIYTEPVNQYTETGSTSVNVSKFCQYCYDDTFTTPDKTIKKKRNDLLSIPPYILVKNTSDATVLAGLDTKFNNETKASNNQIGLTTLQPILQSNGDFKNKYAQDTDKKRHSISVVGRGGVNHGQALAGITDIIIKNNIEDNKYGGNPDFNGANDLRLSYFMNKTRTAGTDTIAGNCVNISSYPLNNRFIGLRGPLIMHGWGYDLDGYPVPNAGDEPKEVDINGRFKRHKKKQSRDLDGNLLTDENNNPIYEDDYEHPGDFPGGSIAANDLGSVIGKTQEWIGGKWTPPKKSDKFFLNWGERPDLWPVGPIDLRWDAERKVWTAPQPKVYKNVYVTLEEDLDTVQNPEDSLKPARGFISDLEYETTAENNRKIVFVVDQSGYTAPRGAKLLCCFNPDKGFYEVLTRPTYTVLGTIQSNGSQATINLSYIQSKNRSILTDDTLTTTFNNPLGFNVTGGQRGMFMYMDGSWTLIATNS